MLFDCKYRTEIIRKDGAGQQQGKGRPALAKAKMMLL